MQGNYLAPRLVALAKDSALALYLDSWQNLENIKTYKDILKIFSDNDIDSLENSFIVIKEEFKMLNLPELAKMIEESYKSMENVIKNTLRFVGNLNDGPGIDKFDWGHHHH